MGGHRLLVSILPLVNSEEKIGERIKNQTRHNEVLSFLGKKRRLKTFSSPLGAGEETDLIASNLWVGESH
jgi:hypothetical protein